MWDQSHKIAPGILNTMIPNLWLYLRFWWNKVNFLSTRITVDILYLTSPILAPWRWRLLLPILLLTGNQSTAHQRWAVYWWSNKMASYFGSLLWSQNTQLCLPELRAKYSRATWKQLFKIELVDWKLIYRVRVSISEVTLRGFIVHLLSPPPPHLSVNMRIIQESLPEQWSLKTWMVALDHLCRWH